MAILKEDNETIKSDEQDEEEDRISNLPDCLLTTILSLLPVDSAAVTSVLSHRWRYLWTHTTNLSFPLNTCKYLQPTDLCHIISQLNSRFIHSFRSHLIYYEDEYQDYQPYNEPGSSFLLPFITDICLRKPEVIVISITHNYTRNNYYDADTHFLTFKLPTSLFATQSLIELDFMYAFEFEGDINNDDVSFINLPNLKQLRLRIRNTDRYYFLTKLVQSCPVLERLDIKVRCNAGDEILFDIIAPNLNYLHITVNTNDRRSNVYSIDTPNLQYLTIDETLPCFRFLNDNTLRCLQEARVKLPYSTNNDVDDYYLNRVVPIFQGISSVKSLTLCYFMGIILKDVEDDLPIFQNLTNLTIDCGISLGSGQGVPSCLLINLKTVNIIGLRTRNRESIKLMEDFVSKAPVLELLDVEARSILDKAWMEYSFCMKLFKFPRCSPDCLIKFKGDIITASSDVCRNQFYMLFSQFVKGFVDLPFDSPYI